MNRKLTSTAHFFGQPSATPPFSKKPPEETCLGADEGAVSLSSSQQAILRPGFHGCQGEEDQHKN
jgi:hypothetical protein